MPPKRAPVIAVRNRARPYDPRAELRAAQAALNDSTARYEADTIARREAAIRANEIGKLSWTEIGRHLVSPDHPAGVTRTRAQEVAYPRRLKTGTS